MTVGRKHRVRPALLAFAFASAVFWVIQTQGGPVAIDPDDIGGTVTSSKGPEAGVWVIAETTDLPTKFARIVVTDDGGRYVLPDLPRATYQVFVRGYGLVDSPRTTSKPGQRLDLKAIVAPDGRAAAQVYPANYWLSLMEIPKGDVTRTCSWKPRRATPAIRWATWRPARSRRILARTRPVLTPGITT